MITDQASASIIHSQFLKHPNYRELESKIVIAKKIYKLKHIHSGDFDAILKWIDIGEYCPVLHGFTLDNIITRVNGAVSLEHWVLVIHQLRMQLAKKTGSMDDTLKEYFEFAGLTDGEYKANSSEISTIFINNWTKQYNGDEEIIKRIKEINVELGVREFPEAPECPNI